MIDRDAGHGLIGGVSGDALQPPGSHGFPFCLRGGDRLILGFLGRGENRRVSLRPAEDLGQLLDRAEGDAVAGSEDERGHHRGADERGAE